MQQGSYLPSLKSSQLMHLRCWNMPNIAFYFLCYFTDKYAICSSYEYFISSDISSITVRLISETRLRMVQCPKDSRKCIRAVCVCVCVCYYLGDVWTGGLPLSPAVVYIQSAVGVVDALFHYALFDRGCTLCRSKIPVINGATAQFVGR